MESINLNIIPGKDRPVCHASQFDIGRQFHVNLFEGFNVFTLDGTETISLSVRKPDGNVVTASVTNTSDSYVEFVTTEQMTACEGSNLCELKLEKGSDVIGTANFILEVELDPLEGGVQSASEIDNLQTQVAGMVAIEVADQYDSANVIFDAVPTAGHGVGYAVTSEGIKNEFDALPQIDDNSTSATGLWSSDKTDTELSAKQDASDSNLTTTDQTIVGAINELNSDKQNVTDNSLTTTNKQIVPAINEVRDYNNLVGKPIFHDGMNKTSFNIPLPKRDPNSYYNGLLLFQTGPAASYGLFLVFVGTGANPTITVNKLGGSSTTPTFTGSFANGVLTLVASATIYGGITYIGF